MSKPLKEVRKAKGIGVRRLSQGAPVSPRTVITTEKGESVPTLETIRKISGFLGVDPMEVSEFRAVLEEQGLEGLPESSSVAESGPIYAESRLDRGHQIEELLHLMRVLEREDVDTAYRLMFRDEPPQR